MEAENFDTFASGDRIFIPDDVYAESTLLGEPQVIITQPAGIKTGATIIKEIPLPSFAVESEESPAPSNVFEKIKQKMLLVKSNKSIAILPGISTGLVSLDNAIQGYQEGDVITIAACSGIGKSWVTLNVIINTAIDQKIPTLLISLEMSREKIFYRLLSLLTRISSEKMKDGTITGAELALIEEAYNSLMQAPLIIEDDDEKYSKLANLSKRIKDAHANGVKFIAIDHIGLIHVGDSFSNIRIMEMANITRTIKQLAKKLRVTIFNCAQLNRGAEVPNKSHYNPVIPKGYHLRESATIKQDSDILILLYRPEKDERPTRTGMIDFIIDKNRDGDEVTLTFTYDPISWKIYDPKTGRNKSKKMPGLGGPTELVDEVDGPSEQDEAAIMDFEEIRRSKPKKNKG